MRILMLVLLLVPALALACPRPKAFPAALPLTPCPLRAENVGCDRCLANQEHVTVTYAGEAAAVGDAFAAALRAAGWTVEVTARASSEPPKLGDAVLTITARRDKASVSALVMFSGRDATRVALVFSPG